MALTVGVNSWVTQTEANNYLEDKIDASAWSALSSANKDKYLISAFRWIKQQSKYSIPNSATSYKVKWAQIETAFYMLTYWTEHQQRAALQSQGVKNFRLLSWSETFSKNAGLPIDVEGLLEDYLTAFGGSFFDVERDYNEDD